jgi:hypothetical protein
MTKDNTEHRKSLIQRVDHHEKILALLADRLNNNVNPELKMLAGAIQKNKDDIGGIVDWMDEEYDPRIQELEVHVVNLQRSWWQRVKDRLPW